MPDSLINLAQTQTEPEPINLQEESTSNIPVSPQVAPQRAFKAQFGTGMSYDEVLAGLLRGEEDKLRKQAAAKQDFDKEMRRQKIITEFAQKKQGPMTAEELRQLDTFLAREATNPNTVFEVSYGKAYMDYLNVAQDNKRPLETPNWNWQDTVLGEANRTIPNLVQKSLDSGSSLVAKMELLQKKTEDTHDIQQNQGWIPWGVDLSKSLIPGYTEYKLRGNVPGVSYFSGARGAQARAEGQKLWSLPVDQFKSELDRIVDGLAKDNPSLAMEWLNLIKGQSTSDEVMNNIWGTVDVASAYPILKGMKRLVSGSVMKSQVDSIVKDVAKAAANVDGSGGASKATISAATGDIGEAAVQQATTNLVKNIQGKGDAVSESLSGLPSYLRTDREALGKGNAGGNFGAQLVNKINERSSSVEGAFTTMMETLQKVQRIPGVLAVQEAIRLVKNEVRDIYPHFKNSILDITDPIWEPKSNTYWMNMDIGKQGGELWMTKSDADRAAQAFGIKGYTAEQQGAGWFIRVREPLRETSDVVRDFLVKVNDSKSPDSFMKRWVGWILSPEDTMSIHQQQNRKTATYAISEMEKVAFESAQEIRAIKPKLTSLTPIKDRVRWNGWQRVLEAAEDVIDPATGKKGYFFKTPAELEMFYQKTLKRLPDEKEVEAYFSFVRNNEIDRTLRNLAIYKNKVRIGTKTHRFFTMEPDISGTTSETTSSLSTSPRKYSDWFDGVLQKEFPSSEDPVVVVGKLFGNSKGSARYYDSTNLMTPKMKDELQAGVKSGQFRVIQIYDPELRPLQTFSDKIGEQRVRYAIVSNSSLETKNISWDQLPRRGGGHIEYDYDFYLKQAIVRPNGGGSFFRHWYEGDTTVMPITIRKMGADVADRLNEVRTLLKAKDFTAAETAAKAIPVEWNIIKGWFAPSFGPDGKKLSPRLSLDEPFRVVPRNKMIIDIDNTLKDRYPETFKDGTRQGSLARQYQVQFTGQRDAEEMFTLRDVGSKGNPIYKMEKAATIDPITTINRALSRIIDSSFMDDYKTFSVEHWLEEAKGSLKNAAEARYAPFHVFHSPEWLPGTGQDVINRFMSNRFKILQLLGQPSSIDTFLHSAANSLADTMYSKFGPGKGELVAQWLLPKLGDPIPFIRGMAFHAKLGFFNPAQILVQSQTYAAIYAIAGYKYASSGSYATMLHWWSTVNRNPAILDKLDEMAAALRLPGTSRWRLGEFKESIRELERTGFKNVAGEYSQAQMNPAILRTGTQSFLNLGDVFFRLGEKNVRLGAWHTAFREFRDEFPTLTIGNAERAKILNRADLLTVNMSRASSSILHTGILSFPAQFLSYQLRTAELFFSKRLGDTVLDRSMARARMLGWYSALYGVPMSLGVSGVPVGDWFRKSALEHGYTPSDNDVKTLFMEGLPAYMMALSTGKNYNVGERFGIQGFEPIREAMRSDQPWWKLLGGASVSILKNTWDQSDGFYHAMVSQLSGQNQPFPTKIEDTVDVFKEISTFNNAWRAYMAYQTGRLFSKKETYLDKASLGDALFMGVTGLQPSQTSDLNLLAWSKKDQEEVEKYATNQFIKEFRRGLLEGDKNPAQAKDYFSRAFNYGQVLPDEKVTEAIALATKDHEPLVDRINWDFYFRSAPKDQQDVRLKAYQRILRSQGK